MGGFADIMDLFLKKIERVSNCRGIPAQRKKHLVVLRIAHARNIRQRNSHGAGGGRQTRRLVDTCRQYHQRSFVENHFEFQPQFLDGFQHYTLVVLLRRHNSLPNRQRRYCPPAEAINKLRRRHRSEDLFLIFARPEQQGPVLRNNAVEQSGKWANLLQIRKLATRHQNQLSTSIFPPRQRRARSFGHVPMLGNRAIVVRGERQIFWSRVHCNAAVSAWCAAPMATASLPSFAGLTWRTLPTSGIKYSRRPVSISPITSFVIWLTKPPPRTNMSGFMKFTTFESAMPTTRIRARSISSMRWSPCLIALSSMPQVILDRSASTLRWRYGAQFFNAMTSASLAMADLLG